VTPSFPEPLIDASRSEELRARLRVVQERIVRACSAAGRDAASVTLVVVTKTYPASDVRLLSELGVTDVAENRDQEAAAKTAECAGLGLAWHFVGQVQTNKARSVARYASCVHAVDRPGLVAALSRAAGERAVPLDCLVQVSLDPVEASAGRGGAAPDAVEEVAAAIDGSDRLRLAGVMGVAPLGGDAAAAYRALLAVQRRLAATYPSATFVSGGMSGDFREAIAAGATHVRVGSAVLGERPPNR